MVENENPYVNPCSEPNALTGFPPTKEKEQEWLEKIRANGVKEGDEVLLVGGINENKVTTFTYDLEKLRFNDCGVTSKKFNGGWFYNQSTDKACKPLYLKLTGEELDVFGDDNAKNVISLMKLKNGKTLFFVLVYQGKGQDNNRVIPLGDGVSSEVKDFLRENQEEEYFLIFDSARDMYIYLSHLEELAENEQE